MTKEYSYIDQGSSDASLNVQINPSIQEPNGLKKIWNRRFKSVLIWLGTCFGLVLGERYLGWNTELVRLLIEKSTWLIGLLIIGLSGTDAMRDWIQKYK